MRTQVIFITTQSQAARCESACLWVHTLVDCTGWVHPSQLYSPLGLVTSADSDASHKENAQGPRKRQKHLHQTRRATAEQPSPCRQGNSTPRPGAMRSLCPAATQTPSVSVLWRPHIAHRNARRGEKRRNKEPTASQHKRKGELQALRQDEL